LDYYSYFKFLINQIHNKTKYKKQNSIFSINYNNLKKKGIKLIIFDMVDTLTDHKGILSKKTKTLLKKLSNSFKIAILSNCNYKRQNQIIKMVKNLDVYVENTNLKPKKTGFVNILKHFNIKKKYAVMIGDRVGSDIYGAKNAGIKKLILVIPYSKFFGGNKANLFYRILRKIEN